MRGAALKLVLVNASRWFRQFWLGVSPLAVVCAHFACSADDSGSAGTVGGRGGDAATLGGAGAALGGVAGGGAGGTNGGAASGNGGATGGGGTASGDAGAASGSGAGATNAGGGGAGTGGAAIEGWKLSWSDEFDGPAGEKPDASKWAYDIGGDGWGNNELEYYTDRADNAATDGQGQLVITLKAERLMNRDYTSARLKTLGKFTQTFGRFEARIKSPRGPGVWPAFWMLGADIQTNSWPQCGEIDIMEIAGKEPRVNHGSLHGPGYSGGSPLTSTYTLPSGELSDDFHVYAVEWEENVVRWYVDASLYQTRRSSDVPSGGTWVYDHDFFMILNVAIGGSFGGAPDASTVLPQKMLVDYVRVYERP